jgi:flavorubredoxin
VQRPEFKAEPDRLVQVPCDHISFWEGETIKTGKRKLRFIMTPHVHHWDRMMMFEETTKSLFTSDLFIQPGSNRPVSSDDLSQSMIGLYRAVGIFASEKPVRQTTRRLEKLSSEMAFPMHGSCIEKSMLPKYVKAIMDSEFAFYGKLLGQELAVS